MANIPQTRPDQSGGFMLVRYSDGTHTHRTRYHLQDFNVNGTDLVYSVPGNQTETDVQATFTALAGVLRPFYNTGWNFSLDAVYRNTGPDPNRAGYNLFVELFGYTVPNSILGSGATATPATSQAGMLVYNFHTLQGGRARSILIGAAGWNANNAGTVQAASGGAIDQQLVAYLSGAATGIVGHDGAKLAPVCRFTSPYNRRLRRRYGQA